MLYKFSVAGKGKQYGADKTVYNTATVLPLDVECDFLAGCFNLIYVYSILIIFNLSKLSYMLKNVFMYAVFFVENI